MTETTIGLIPTYLNLYNPKLYILSKTLNNKELLYHLIRQFLSNVEIIGTVKWFLSLTMSTLLYIIH